MAIPLQTSTICSADLTESLLAISSLSQDTCQIFQAQQCTLFVFDLRDNSRRPAPYLCSCLTVHGKLSESQRPHFDNHLGRSAS